MPQRPARALAQRYAAVPLLAAGDTVLIATAKGARRYRLDWSEQGPCLRRVMKITKKPQAALAKDVEPV